MSSSPTETASVEVVLPAVGTSITEATVVAWRKRVGETVAADETICEVSTDKVDVECPSPASGTVVEILVEEGTTVEVGTILARIAAAGAGASGGDETGGGGNGDAPEADDDAPEAGIERGRGRRRFFSPVARRIAAERGVDLEAVTGTGRNGRVTKRDVLAHSVPERPLHGESPYRPPAPAASEAGATSGPEPGGGDPEVSPLSRMRRSIGAAMLRSQATAATCHTLIECDMSAVEAKRAELGITALPLLAAAVVETLAEFGDLNATLAGEELSRYRAVHLGIAVSLGDEGLIVPVLRDAQSLSPRGIGEAIRDLARRARAAELAPDEVRGATFTITNPGAYGALAATPVIDLPQVGILDFEAIVRRPVVVADADGGEAITIRSMANLILGWDHRAIDGVYAARFLAALRTRLEAA